MNFDKCIDVLANNGYGVFENFISPSLCLELVSQIKHKQQLFHSAKIGSQNQLAENKTIRSDKTFWLDSSSGVLCEAEYLKFMNEYQQLINRELYLGLKSFECHYAIYRDGDFYKTHLDQFQGKKVRFVTAITYLNAPEAGGELNIYSPHDPHQLLSTVFPRPGTFVTFLSDQFPHEVLPCSGTRYSITGWFRNTMPE